MPILSYFAIVGSVLVALLFAADATLEKSGPLPFNNESIGLPKPWRPEMKSAILAETPAPEPETTAALSAAAVPPAPQSTAVPATAAAAKVQAAPERVAKLEPAPRKLDPAPKKNKRVVARKQPRPESDRRSYAWSRNGNDSGFFGGGGSTFGRF